MSKYDLYEVRDDFITYLIDNTGGIKEDGSGTNVLDNKVGARNFSRTYFGKIYDPNDPNWFYIVPFTSQAMNNDGTLKLLPTGITFTENKNGVKHGFAIAKFSGMIPIPTKYSDYFINEPIKINDYIHSKEIVKQKQGYRLLKEYKAINHIKNQGILFKRFTKVFAPDTTVHEGKWIEKHSNDFVQLKLLISSYCRQHQNEIDKHISNK